MSKDKGALPNGPRALIGLGLMAIMSIVGVLGSIPSVMVLTFTAVMAIEVMISGGLYAFERHAKRSKALVNAERRPTHLAEAVAASQAIGFVTPEGAGGDPEFFTKRKRVNEIDAEIERWEKLALDHTTWGLKYSPWALAALVADLRAERDVLVPPEPPEPEKRSQRSRWQVPILDGGYQRTIEATEADMLAAMSVPDAARALPLGGWEVVAPQLDDVEIPEAPPFHSVSEVIDYYHRRAEEVTREGSYSLSRDDERRRADQLEDDLTEAQARTQMLERQVEMLTNEKMRRKNHDTYSMDAYQRLLAERDEALKQLSKYMNPCYYCRGRGCSNCNIRDYSEYMFKPNYRPESYWGGAV